MLENLHATSALIGSVLFENSLIHNVTDVQPEHLRGVEARVWGAMLSLAQRGVPINTLSIEDELGSEYRQRAASVLAAAINGTPAVGNIEQYAGQVLDAFERRQAILYAEELVRAANNDDEDIASTKAEIAGRLLRSEKRAAEFSGDDLAEMDIAEVEQWADDPMPEGEVRGIPTGWRDMDRLLDGLWPGYAVLAARTSVGKTALGTQLSTNISATAPVYYVGLEHRPVVYWRRMVGQMSGIPYKHVKRGLTGDELRRWKAAGDALRGRRIAVYNGSRKLPTVMGAINRAFHRWGELGLVVIDNLGHLQTGEDRAYETLGTVSLAVLELSQRLGCTILGLHQINRGVEGRNDKRPAMSDLRDSGYIEETADAVWLAYRDDYYNPENSMEPNVIEVAVAKNREDGATGVVKLAFDKATGRISDARNY